MNNEEYKVTKHFDYKCFGPDKSTRFSKRVDVIFYTDTFNIAYDCFNDFMQSSELDFNQYYDGNFDESIYIICNLYKNNNLQDSFGTKKDFKTGLTVLKRI